MKKKRHRWSSTPTAGQSAECLDCGTTLYHQHNHIKVFTAPGSTLKVNQRPPCIPTTKPISPSRSMDLTTEEIANKHGLAAVWPAVDAALNEYAAQEAQAYQAWLSNQVLAGRTHHKLWLDYKAEVLDQRPTITVYRGPADEPDFVPPAFEMSEHAIQHWFGPQIAQAASEAAVALRNEADEYAAKQGLLPDGSLAFTRIAEAYEAGARSRTGTELAIYNDWERELRQRVAAERMDFTEVAECAFEIPRLFKIIDVLRGELGRAGGEIHDNKRVIDQLTQETHRWAEAVKVLEAERASFQGRVAAWMQETFGPEVSADFTERGFRFGEEAIELLQANGTSKADVLKLVDYVYSRPVGELAQEVGGTLVTLAALCQARGIDMMGAANTEQARVEQPAVRAKIQAKQEDKRRNMIASPLPGTATTMQDAGHE